jgi:predicted nucleic acid-binding Zn ribbon protein
MLDIAGLLQGERHCNVAPATGLQPGKRVTNAAVARCRHVVPAEQRSCPMRSILLYLLGVPVVVIILLNVFNVL